MAEQARRSRRGRAVLVTGGAGGIGRACGAWFAARGDDVALADLEAGACEAAAGGCGARLGVRLDVTDEGEVASVFERVEAELGPLSVLVNAAGVVGSGSLEQMALAEWSRVVDTNLTGTFLCCRAAIPAFRRAGGGKIVNLSSVNARTGGNDLSGGAYAASKAGIEALTRHLARALAPSVQVNAVAPGLVDTPMLHRLDSATLAGLSAAVPAGRVSRPEEVAEAVGFLASAAADFVTGVVLDQNGGQWLGP